MEPQPFTPEEIYEHARRIAMQFFIKKELTSRHHWIEDATQEIADNTAAIARHTETIARNTEEGATFT
jgi:hypothetical protein